MYQLLGRIHSQEDPRKIEPKDNLHILICSQICHPFNRPPFSTSAKVPSYCLRYVLE